MATQTPSSSGNHSDSGNFGERRCGRDVSTRWYRYRSYGLGIRSQLELPELDGTVYQNHSSDDVEILLDDVPDRLEGGVEVTPWLQATQNCCLLDGGDIARYRIENGTRIIVDRRSSTSRSEAERTRDVRVYLLGAAFAALLHQRQWLPLHISAVATSEGAVAFTGPSGAGKSTIAAWLHFRCQLALITDDMAVIRPDDIQPFLYPGPSRLKLWDDAIRELGLQRHGLVRDLVRADKFHLPNPAGIATDQFPLVHLVVLRRNECGTTIRLEEIHGIEAYRAVMNAVYRPGLNKLFYNKGQLHAHAGALARKIRVHTLDRPWSLNEKDQVLEKLLNHLGISGDFT